MITHKDVRVGDKVLIRGTIVRVSGSSDLHISIGYGDGYKLKAIDLDIAKFESCIYEPGDLVDWADADNDKNSGTVMFARPDGEGELAVKPVNQSKMVVVHQSQIVRRFITK